MEIWVMIELGALLGGIIYFLTGCSGPEEEVQVISFDDITGNNGSWDKSEVYDEVKESEVQNGERGTCMALVSCTSASNELETVKIVADGNEQISDISQLNKNDIMREAPFSGCRLSPDRKCTLDTSYIEGGAWQDYDENYDMGLGKNALDCDRSYMFCQYGHGIIFFKDAGQTFKDQVEEKAEDELLITLDILQGMVVYDDGGDESKHTEEYKVNIVVQEIESYDLKSFSPNYKEVRDYVQKDIDELNRVLYIYEINTPNRIAHFLAQCTVESHLGERPLERYNGEIIEYFEKLYGPNTVKGKELGNTIRGDAAKYRGAGAIHLTGKDAYNAFANYVCDETIKNDGALYVAQKYFWESAAYYWSVYKPQTANDDRYNLNKMCDEGYSVQQITDIVRGSNVELREQAYKYFIDELNKK